MTRDVSKVAAAIGLSLGLTMANPAVAQKAGGILKVGHFDSPASMSMHEEATNAVNRPMSGILNNLIMYNQDVKQNSPQSIVPDLATGWSWNEEGTELTFPLRQGVAGIDRRPAGRQHREKSGMRPHQMKGDLVVAFGGHFLEVYVPGLAWVQA